MHEVAQARFEEGAAPRLDVMQAQLGLSRAKADLELARSARTSAQAELNALLSRPPAEPLAVEGDIAQSAPLPAVEQVVARAAAGNAELRSAEHEVAIEERRLGLLKAERVPTPVFSVGAVFDAPGEFDVGYRAGLSLAVPLFDRNQGQIRGPLARGEQARLRPDALRLSVEAKASRRTRAPPRAARWPPIATRWRPPPPRSSRSRKRSYRLGAPRARGLDAQRTLRDAKSEYSVPLSYHGARRPGGCSVDRSSRPHPDAGCSRWRSRRPWALPPARARQA